MISPRRLAACAVILLAAPALAQTPSSEGGDQPVTPAALAAEAAAAFGPALDEAAPAFTALNGAGVEQSLSQLTAEQGLVLYFNRSLDWCPICVRQTLELDAAADAFAQAGWAVAVLTYDTVDTLAEVKDRRGLGVTVLSDPDSVIIDAFGVRDPIYADPDHLAYGVPYPIAFAIRSDGTIAGKYWHEAGLGQERGYAVRVSAEDVLADLD